MKKSLQITFIGLGLIGLTISCSKKDVSVSKKIPAKIVSMEKHADIKENWTFTKQEPAVKVENSIENRKNVSTTSAVLCENTSSEQISIADIKETLRELKTKTTIVERKELFQLVKEAKKNPSEQNVSRAKNLLQEKAVSDNTLLLVIVAIFIPPLAVYLLNNSITDQFWIDLILTLLFFIPGMIYALYLILS